MAEAAAREAGAGGCPGGQGAGLPGEDMRLLFITDHLPYPPTDGWKIRVFAFLRGLAQRHDITLVSFSRPVDDATAVGRLRELGINVHVIQRDARYSPVKLARGLFGRTAFP